MSIQHGHLGGGDFEVDTNQGSLRWNGSEVIVMRVKLINSIFGSIMENQMFSTFINNAGVAAGEDYALSFILGGTPNTPNQQDLNIPESLLEQGKTYLSSRGSIMASTNQAESLNQASGINSSIRSSINTWIQGLTSSQIQHLWNQMNDLDVFSGWGKAEVTDLDLTTFSATINVTNSFISRESAFWRTLGFNNRKVCTFLAGYFLGESQIMLGRDDLTCIESSCSLEKGGDICVFTVNPGV